MGCATSKLDNLPAVALCRDRCNFLEDALLQSYDFANAHLGYMESVKAVGVSLHRFFEQSSENEKQTVSASGHAKSHPIVSSPDHSRSSSNSDSHIKFDSDSDEEETEKVKDRVYLNHPNNEALTPSVSDMFTLRNYSNHDSDTASFQNYHLSGDVNAKTAHDWTYISPPPPAPTTSAWDFFNFFETYDLLYEVSKDNKEMKFEEEARVVENESVMKTGRVEDFIGNGAKDTSEQKSADNDKKEKCEKSRKEKAQCKSESNESKSGSCQRSISEITKELQGLFEGASESGNELLKMLDTGKFHYHQKNSVYQHSSKMLHTVNQSLSALSYSSSTEKIRSVNHTIDEISVSFTNLSSTLKKLCMWETKLYNEVKAEEKLRTNYAKRLRQMKRLEEKGAEANKIETARTLLRTISTKMKVAIHVIDKISVTINELRDDELWPQVCELIKRLSVMWKSMQEWHRRQSQTWAEIKSLDTVALKVKLNSAHLERAIQLESDLQNWNLLFSNWIKSQKGYVIALGGWLRRCLLHEPEETPDGIAPYSPGRFGAPPVFVFVNQWSEVFDTLSEKEASEAIRRPLMVIKQLIEQHNVDLQQKILSEKYTEEKTMILDKDDELMQKILQTRAKKMTSLTVEENELIQTCNMQFDLKQVFAAMERFADDSRKVYEDLHVRIEESRKQADG